MYVFRNISLARAQECNLKEIEFGVFIWIIFDKYSLF